MSQKSIETLAREVIAGKWGNGEERKKRLTAAGYDYDAVQKRVNEILNASSSSSTSSSTSSSFSYLENSKTSGNAYSKRNLKRMKLEYDGTTVKFAVNPEDYTQSEPNRATLTQTKGGAWIDAWGGGIRELTIKGTTGVKGTGNSIDTGYNRWKELRNLIRSVYDSVTDGQEIENLIKFYNYTDNEYFYCYPAQGGIELYRSKSRPHIYQYTIHLWVIRKLGEPASSSGAVGNPNKPIDSGSSTKTTKNQTVETSSGSNAVFSSRITDSQADMITATNTKTKTISGIQEDCREYFTALEPLIGGNSGKISPITGFQCAQGITMQSSGTVSNVTAFTGLDLTSVGEISTLLMSEIKFISRVSTETYMLYTKIKEYSPDVLSPNYTIIPSMEPKQRIIYTISNSTSYDSTIFEFMVKYQKKLTLSKTETNQLKIILLESMLVYQELYKLYYQSEELNTVLTSTNIEVLINNIRAMIMCLNAKYTNQNAKYDRMDISNELRQLEKIFSQVKTDVITYM